MHRLSDVIISFKTKIIEKPDTVLLLDAWFLSWNKKFQNLISAWVGAARKPT